MPISPPVVFSSLPGGLNPLSLFDQVFNDIYSRLGVVSGAPTIITSGASYAALLTDTRILINKTIGSATTVVLQISGLVLTPVLVYDLKGDSGTNTITVAFSGGQLCNNVASIPISSAFSGFWFNPLASGWYVTAA